jgi:hypothetical protein
MLNLLKLKINIGLIVNPFFLYGLSFVLALFVYTWGWSSIFPVLSTGLILFLAITIFVFFFIGINIKKRRLLEFRVYNLHSSFIDYIFLIIIGLGLLNVFWMGYLPVLDRSHNYREFGMPVVDPVFNTLSIFFSVFFVQVFLIQKKKRFLIYIFLILIFQVLLFRRSTIIWIFTSGIFIYIINKQRVNLVIVAASIALVPLFSYCFGLFGSTRSHLTPSFVINNLKASDSFRNSNINQNHYLTYLYISSPLANLQENIDESNGGLTKENFKLFIFYSVMPESITLRFENKLNLTPPACRLIIPELIVGSFYMVAFYTLGWYGMVLMYIYLALVIGICLLVIRKWDMFSRVTLALLATTVCMLIFSNFLNRLDVILMLFAYPVIFHILFSGSGKVEVVADPLK